MRFANGVVKLRIPILIAALALCVLSVFGMARTRINYDMLTYLPQDMETVKGQDVLLKEFGKGAFAMVIVEGMDQSQVSALRKSISEVDHVADVIWYDTFLPENIPMEMLPQDLYEAFNSGDSTMMAVFFDSGTSADETIEAVGKIRQITDGRALIAGMSAMVADLKELCEKEEAVYVAIAVICACIVMMLLLDGWLVPFVFLASIGVMVLMNMGSNFIFGEISYITKALAAVLQLAVTMDYSIFLWHSYNEHSVNESDRKQAMAAAIRDTLTSVVGSSVTTIAGFIALCFMSFTLGRDLGLIMAKGVLLGVIGSVTVLPSMILVLDRPLQATRHRALIPDCGKAAGVIVKIFPLFLVLFIALIPPFYYAYKKANAEVYYTIADSLPEDMDFRIANKKLRDDYDMSNVQMILVSSSLSQSEVNALCDELGAVDGVKYVLGLESVTGDRIPREMLPDAVTSQLISGRYELLLFSSEYGIATDEVSDQINEVNRIIKSHDPSSMLIGEAACTKDMIEVTDIDFARVNLVSIAMVFVIILLVERSISLPFILVAVIELGIFINLGISHFTGEQLPFIAPICISTIQLGATVDYAILMTTRYRSERIGGASKRDAVKTALSTSIPSILTSGLGLFGATFGVYVYTDIDIIGSMCLLLSRGALISMALVILILPALLMLCDGLVRHTTLGMRNCTKA